MATSNSRSGQGSRSKGTQTRKTTGSTNVRSRSGKSTSATNRRTYSKQTLRKKQEKEAELRNEIIMIISFAVCILLFLCNFQIMGPFGKTVKGIMFGMFGILSYVLPIAIFIGMAFHISNHGNQVAVRKIVAGIILIYCIGVFVQMISVPLEYVEGKLIPNLFEFSKEKLKGGGVFCGVIAYPMMKYLKTVGSVLVLLVIMIIALVVITERSFINGVKKGGHRVYESARENADRRREEKALRYEEIYDEDDDGQYEFRKKARTVSNGDPESLKARRRHHVPDYKLDVAEQNTEFVRGRLDEEISKEENPSTLMAGTKLQKPLEQIRRENMHEIMIEDLEPEEDTFFAKTEPDKIEEDNSFEFDLYRDMPEPKGTRNDVHMQEDTIYVQEELKSLEPELYEEDIDKVPSAIAQTPLPDTYRPQGADTFGTAMEQGYTPKKPQHSFGMKEEYRTPDQKKADAAPVVAIPKTSVVPKKYIFPSLNLLTKGSSKNGGDSSRQLKETAARLQQTLKTFGVNVTITDISQGPAVTRYEMQPELGVKVSKIVSLADDIKLNLAATDIRIEAPIPGKAAVGIEVPNKENSAVNLRELLESDNFKKFDSNLAFAVGKDIAGQTVVFDIAKMPHVLIAGSTGSGKSVCINTLIMSILYKAHPDDVKLIMVDPKVVELSVYNGIPHLLIPVVTDPKKAAAALQWAVAEMTERYKKFADHNVRDLKGYNKLAESMKDSGKADAPTKMPQIVIIVDELADLMMVASGDVEEAIVRLAQLARAAGIHLVIATQRPSVDVITGLIKANMPSRVAFAVSSGVDSRTILDMNGAEKLLGKGDMLFYPQGYSKPARVQGAFVSDKEVSDVVDFLKNQAIGNVYGADLEEKISHISASSESGSASAGGSDLDDLFVEAGRFIIEKDKASIGMLQRAFRVGFNRAARIMDQLADAGVVGEEEGTKPRKVLMSMEQFENYVENQL